MKHLGLRLWSSACVPASLLTMSLTCLAAAGQQAGQEQHAAQQAAQQKTAQQPATTGYRVVQGVPFRQAGNTTYLADFYLPEGNGPSPAILFIHGGGWRGGDRKQLQRQAIFMAKRGMVGMAIDYRLAPANPFPAALEDSRAGLAYLRNHAAQYHVDPDRIALVGSSAGAHLAALTATTADETGKDAAARVEAVVAFNGIFDFAAISPSTMVSDFLGGSCVARPDVCKQASPVDHVHRGIPPFLILHGTADKTAPYEQAKAFVDKLKAAGNPVELFTAEGAPHTFWAEKKWLGPTEQAMCLFLRAKLAPAQSFASDCSAGDADAPPGDVSAPMPDKSPVAAGHITLELWPHVAPGAIADAKPELDTTTAKSALVAGRSVIRTGNVSIPALTVFAPTVQNAHTAVLVFPGGGWRVLSMDLEGTEACSWLNSRGITCILVKYRVPGSGPYPESAAALQDAQRALRLVRQHASAWGIDADHIGVLGFSAGAQVAAAFSIHFDQALYPPVDAIDSLSCRPDFVMLLYLGAMHQAGNLLALKPSLEATAETPPTFLVQAEDDPVHVENSIDYFFSLKRAKVPAELHIYAHGGHGFGLRATALPITHWPSIAETWLRTIHMLPEQH